MPPKNVATKLEVAGPLKKITFFETFFSFVPNGK